MTNVADSGAKINMVIEVTKITMGEDGWVSKKESSQSTRGSNIGSINTARLIPPRTS